MAPADKLIFKVHNLRKSYASAEVLRGISLDITAGTCMLLLGANGSGKSTLLKICAGLIRAESGSAAFVAANNLHSFGYLGHDLQLYSHLSVKENINLMRRLRGVSVDCELLLEEWKLTEHSSKKLSELSRGLQFRAALVAALVHNPKYIFLDEPTSSLDQQTIDLLQYKINNLCIEKEGFALIATHDIHRLSKSATRIAVLHGGVIASDSGNASQLEEQKLKVIGFYNQCNR